MFFLNYFQLLVCYDDGTKLLSNFEKAKYMDIFNHIWEWRRWKSIIKSTVPPEFILKWVLKLLLPYISKDVSTSRVFTEEHEIFREQ